jgi:hypothetical protein
MKKWVVRLVLAGILVIVLVLVGALFFLGSIVKKGVERVGPTITKTVVKLDGATLSILSGSGELKGLFVGNPEGFQSQSAIKVGSVSIGVSPGSVFSQKVVVRSIKVVGPEITFEGGLGGNNLSKILANIQGQDEKDKQATTKKEQSSSKKIQVDDILISGGKINVNTSLLGGKGTSLSLPEIHLSNLGQGGDGITPAELSEKILHIVLEDTLKAVAQSGVDLGKDMTGALKNVGGGAGEKVGKGIGDLFKKK